MSLGDQLSKILGRVQTQMETTVRESIREVGHRLVDRSPVDSGKFINNWKGSEGSINTDTSSEPDKSGAASHASVDAVADNWTPGETVYITSSLPYAERIERGWSGGAPKGVVGLTATEFGDILQEQLRKAKNG